MTDAPTTDDVAEQHYLAKTLELVDAAHTSMLEAIERTQLSIVEQKRQMWEHQRDMDHAEKANMRMEVSTTIDVGRFAVTNRDSLERLRNSPYFGRVDFQHTHTADPHPYYIGVHGFWDPETQNLRVHDWRAPVSSLYYDYETGAASFEAPEGTAWRFCFTGSKTRCPQATS